jgi:hypothetical protein
MAKGVKFPVKPFSGIKHICGPIILYRKVPLCVVFNLQWNKETNALSVIPGACIKSAEFSKIYDEFHFLWTWIPEIAFNSIETSGNGKSEDQLAVESGLIDYMRFIDWILDSDEERFKISLNGMIPKLLGIQKEARALTELK